MAFTRSRVRLPSGPPNFPPRLQASLARFMAFYNEQRATSRLSRTWPDPGQIFWTTEQARPLHQPKRAHAANA